MHKKRGKDLDSIPQRRTDLGTSYSSSLSLSSLLALNRPFQSGLSKSLGLPYRIRFRSLIQYSTEASEGLSVMRQYTRRSPENGVQR